jgi:hypothetical protein
VCLLAVGSAHAGFKITTGVVIDVTNRHVLGTVAVARAAPDNLSYIGCYVAGFSSGSPLALCFARDSANAQGFCYSYEPGIVQAAASSGPNSYYDFQWDTNSVCTAVQVNNSSYNGPLQP